MTQEDCIQHASEASMGGFLTHNCSKKVNKNLLYRKPLEADAECVQEIKQNPPKTFHISSEFKNVLLM